MSEDEYLLAQCRQHGYDPNSPAEVQLGKDTGHIFDRPEVKPAGLYVAPVTNSVTKVHIKESKHNRTSANFTQYSHRNLACVLVTHIYPDEDDAHQASALEIC